MTDGDSLSQFQESEHAIAKARESLSGDKGMGEHKKASTP
jgi:hypothetical protein